MASDYTSAYTGAQIDEGLARARNDEALVQDQVKADTGGSLLLSDDSGNGLTVVDGGNVTQTAAKYFATDQIRALGASGLIIGDDAGQGPKVNDGGAITNGYQPCFSAYLTSALTNVTGDNTDYSITGAVWSEIKDVGGTFSNGIHTANISGSYTYGGTVACYGITSSHTKISLALVTSNRTYYPIGLHAYNIARGVSNDIYLAWSIPCVDMDINDTAYLQINVFGGTKVVSLYATSCRFMGFLQV